MPFDTDPDWPKPLQDALTAYRAAWRAKMDEVNACIAANAEMEELVDKPEPVNGVVRVTGPVHDGRRHRGGRRARHADRRRAGRTWRPSTVTRPVAANAEAHLDKIMRLLKASGVDFPGNTNMRFSRLDPLTGASLIHAEASG